MLFEAYNINGKLEFKNRDEEIVPCLWENASCLRNSIYQQLPIRCVQNSAVGFEHEQGQE